MPSIPRASTVSRVTSRTTTSTPVVKLSSIKNADTGLKTKFDAKKQTLTISGGVVTGNAATNGLLDALNTYLIAQPQLTISDATVPAPARRSSGTSVRPVVDEARLRAALRQLADGVDAGVENPTAPTIPTFDTAPTTVTTGIFPYAMSIVKRIKNHKDYAVSDGQDMGIEGEEITEESVNDSKPSLKLVLVNGGHPEVQWVKKNMDAIAIYVSRNNSTWELLAIDTVPNYTDTFSLPASGQAAIWKYKAIYRLNDSNVGQWSDEVSVSVSGV